MKSKKKKKDATHTGSIQHITALVKRHLSQPCFPDFQTSILHKLDNK